MGGEFTYQPKWDAIGLTTTAILGSVPIIARIGRNLGESQARSDLPRAAHLWNTVFQFPAFLARNAELPKRHTEAILKIQYSEYNNNVMQGLACS